jgi:hypothetical protein
MRKDMSAFPAPFRPSLQNPTATKTHQECPLLWTIHGLERLYETDLVVCQHNIPLLDGPGCGCALLGDGL